MEYLLGKKLKRFEQRLKAINSKLENMMATDAEFAASLVALKDQLVKVSAEIVAKFAALEAAIVASGNATPEETAALADARAVVDQLDAMNEDV